MPAWYLEWISSYLVANDANTATGQAMLKAWWPGFSAMNATPEELRAATYDVLSLPSRPIRTADHFAAIKQSIHARRADQDRRRSEDYERPDFGACVLCGGSGVVVVPHPRHCSAEAWRASYSGSKREIFHAAGVLCSCSVGERARQKENAKEPENRAMSLGTYENFVNGNWRQQIAERNAANRVVREIEAGIDPRATIASLAGKFRA